MASGRSDNGAAYARAYYETVRAAVIIACAEYGEPVTPKIRTVISYFALLGRRAEIDDVLALAKFAVEKARENPNILEAAWW